MERFRGIKVKDIHPYKGPPFGQPVFDEGGNEMMQIDKTENKNIFNVGFEDKENPGDLNFTTMSRREIKSLVNKFIRQQDQMAKKTV